MCSAARFRLIQACLLLSFLLSISFAQAKDVPTDAADVCPILVGSTIPDVSLVDSKGKKTDLHALAKASPTLFIFYRGSWCPYCNTHLADLRKIESELQDLGVKVVAVSPDKPEYLNVTEEKQQLTYTLLSDSKMEAAKGFGIAFKADEKTLEGLKKHNISLTKNSGEGHQMLPTPAAFLVDQDLKVNFSFVAPNYKIRVDSQVVLAAARAMQRTKKQP